MSTNSASRRTNHAPPQSDSWWTRPEVQQDRDAFRAIAQAKADQMTAQYQQLLEARRDAKQ